METSFVREIYARYRGGRRKSFRVNGPKEVANFIRGIIQDNTREHFVAVFLDGAHQVSSFAIVSVGTANTAFACPREVFQLAVLSGACAVVVGHNHPSGRLEASPEDIRITGALAAAGELMQIPLLDHVIVTSQGYLSLREGGHL